MSAPSKDNTIKYTYHKHTYTSLPISISTQQKRAREQDDPPFRRAAKLIWSLWAQVYTWQLLRRTADKETLKSSLTFLGEVSRSLREGRGATRGKGWAQKTGLREIPVTFRGKRDYPSPEIRLGHSARRLNRHQPSPSQLPGLSVRPGSIQI